MSSKCSFIIFSCPWDQPSESVAEVAQIIYKLLNLARLKKAPHYKTTTIYLHPYQNHQKFNYKTKIRYTTRGKTTS